MCNPCNGLSAYGYTSKDMYSCLQVFASILVVDRGLLIEKQLRFTFYLLFKGFSISSAVKRESKTFILVGSPFNCVHSF